MRTVRVYVLRVKKSKVFCRQLTVSEHVQGCQTLSRPVTPAKWTDTGSVCRGGIAQRSAEQSYFCWEKMTWGVLGILGNMSWVIRNHFNVIDKHFYTLKIYHIQTVQNGRKENKIEEKKKWRSWYSVCSGWAVRTLSLLVLRLSKLTISSKCYPQRREVVIYRPEGMSLWTNKQRTHTQNAHLHNQMTGWIVKIIVFWDRNEGRQYLFLYDRTFTPSFPSCLCIVWTSSSELQLLHRIT